MGRQERKLKEGRREGERASERAAEVWGGRKVTGEAASDSGGVGNASATCEALSFNSGPAMARVQLVWEMPCGRNSSLAFSAPVFVRAPRACPTALVR